MADGEGRVIWRHSRIYALSNLLNRGAGLILLPVYLHVLQPSEYGLYALLVATTELTGVVLGMGWGNALVRYYVECKSDEERRTVVGTAFLSLLGIMAVFSACAPWLGEVASRLVRGAPDSDWLFAIAFWGLAFTVLLTIQLQLTLVQKRPWLLFAISGAKTAAFLGFNILFVVVFKLGVIGIAWGTLCSGALVSVPFLLWTFSGLGRRFSVNKATEMVRFGLPLVPAVLCDIGLSAVDKYVVNSTLGAGPVGAFALGDRLGQLLRMFITVPFVQIWVVRRLETLDSPQSGESTDYSDILKYFVLAVTTAGLGLSLFAPEIIWIVADPAYASASSLVPFFAMTQIAIAIRYHFEIGIYHAKRTALMVPISAATLIVAPVLIYAGIQVAGLMGAALAVTFVNILRVTLTGVVASRVSSVLDSFPWHQVIAMEIAAVAVATTGIGLFGGQIGAVPFAIKCVLLLGYGYAFSGKALRQRLFQLKAVRNVRS